MVDINTNEIIDYLRKLVNLFNENPLLYSNVLYNIGVSLNVLGMMKREPLLSVIGDLLADAPEKLQSIISLRYSLIGTFSDLQRSAFLLAERKISVVSTMLEKIVSLLALEKLDHEELKKILGTLYEELAYTPSITLAGEQ